MGGKSKNILKIGVIKIKGKKLETQWTIAFTKHNSVIDKGPVLYRSRVPSLKSSWKILFRESKDVNIIETHIKPGDMDDIKLLFGPTPIGNKIIEIEKNANDKI